MLKLFFFFSFLGRLNAFNKYGNQFVTFIQTSIQKIIPFC